MQMAVLWETTVFTKERWKSLNLSTNSGLNFQNHCWTALYKQSGQMKFDMGSRHTIQTGISPFIFLPRQRACLKSSHTLCPSQQTIQLLSSSFLPYQPLNISLCELDGADRTLPNRYQAHISGNSPTLLV